MSICFDILLAYWIQVSLGSRGMPKIFLSQRRCSVLSLRVRAALSTQTPLPYKAVGPTAALNNLSLWGNGYDLLQRTCLREWKHLFERLPQAKAIGQRYLLTTGCYSCTMVGDREDRLKDGVMMWLSFYKGGLETNVG